MMNIKNEVLLTIRCITYNHEHFIRQCLDGFVMQKTNFRFEAIVHDDASTDGTANIIREYAEKYPDIIKPIFETENQYSKHDGSLGRIMNSHMHGKYIAICEGDDYWTDPYKLQKQVDFLESHPDYSMCFHSAIHHLEEDVIKKNPDEKQDRLFSEINDRDYVGTEIYEKWIVPTASVIYRKKVIDSEIYKKATTNRNFIYGDIVLFLSCTQIGKIRGIPDVMSVYRRHCSSATLKVSPSSKEHVAFLKKYFLHNKAIVEVFGHDYERIALEMLEPSSWYIFRESKHHEFQNYWYLIKKYPFFIVYALLRRLKYTLFHI